jgi:geranylgeranyl diphosphate synthase type I
MSAMIERLPDAGSTDAMLDAAMAGAVDALEPASPFLATMARYHMGWVDQTGRALPAGEVDRGKRMRPRIALLCCQAVCGSFRPALPLAAALELLHNFTLVHDDIQDASELRRHRETVWALWGTGQAINAGDALFAASHRLLLDSVKTGMSADTVVRLADAFDRMTIAIVGGQVMDLQFETSETVSHEGYLAMIGRKTAAIVEYAAWAGAIAGGAAEEVASVFGQFGKALGIGFQVQDDLLGVWGAAAETGKRAGDDIRRRKQSLPVILLRQSATGGERNELRAIFAGAEVDDDGVARVLELMDRHAVRDSAESIVREYHTRATAMLDALAGSANAEALQALRDLVATMASRRR